LKVVRELWEAQTEEASLLSLVVLLAEPGLTKQSDLILDGEGAALVVRPGSLLGEVVGLPLRVPSFAVCLLVGGGTSTSARRAEMIERLCRNALSRGAQALRDIRQGLKPTSENKPLVVLVHGLFATDVGTFKALETRLRAFSGQFDLAGFPHDTLSET